MGGVASAVVFILIALFGVLFLYGIHLYEQAQERKNVRRQVTRSAVETYISMRDRKHSTMRRMRQVAREYNDPESRS